MLACAISDIAINRIGHSHHHPASTPRMPCFVCKNHFLIGIPSHLVEEANDLARNVLASGLLVVHDAGRGGEDDIAELTGREQLDNPLLELGEADVVAGGDDTGLVDAAVELDDDFAVAVIVNLLKLANVACTSSVNCKSSHVVQQ